MTGGLPFQLDMLAIVLGATLVNILLRHRPAWGAAIIPVLLVLVPPQAESTYTIFFHPAIYLAVLFLITQFLTDQWGVYEVVRRSGWVLLGMVALSLYASLDLLNFSGIGSPVQLVLTLLRLFGVAFVLFLSMRVGLRHGGRDYLVIVGTLLAVGVFQVYLANEQVTSGGERGYWWRSAYEASWWWVDDYKIGLGTTGHSLQLGLFLASLVPMLMLLRQVWLRYALAIAFIYGITTATARAALILALIAAVYVVAAGSRRWARTGLAAIAAVPVVLAVMGTQAVSTISSKFASDAGSAQLRADAREWAWTHKGEFLFFGYPGSRDLRGAGLLGSSLENGYLMAGLQFGLVFAVGLGLYHLAVMWGYIRRADRLRVPVALSVLIVFVGFNASSSFMAGALDSTLFWAYLGMLAADGDVAQRDRSWDADEHASGAQLLSSRY